MVVYRCKDLNVYNESFESAVRIFKITCNFPKEERYSLTDQVRRSSRSVAANIREGFAKRKYKDVFLRHLNDALGSSEETLTWLEFALRSDYINKENFAELSECYNKIGAMLFKLIKNWQKF